MPALAPPPTALPPFPGLTSEAFTFLRQLKKNNARDWFTPRKGEYNDELRDPMRCLVAQLSQELPERGLPLSGAPRRAVFRVYRDTRFSKDKTPYKTHVAAVLSRDGDKRAPGALYIHVEPGSTRVGGGFWRPDKAFLRLWRERLVADPETFLQIVADLEAAGLTVGTSGSKLTRMPRGFDDHRESPAAEYLRWKGGFAATREGISDEAVQSPDFAGLVMETAEQVRPLLEYGWGLVDKADRERR